MKISAERYWQLKHYEDELINQRLGWLLTSQIVLFAAYGILIKDNAIPGSNKRLIYVIEGLGIAIPCLIFIGITAAIVASYVLYRKVNNKTVNPSNEKQTLGVHPILTIIGWLVAVLIPAIFLIAWLRLS